MKRKNIFCLSMVLMLSSSAALAIPDATRGNPLGTLGLTTPDGVGDVMGDHENMQTLHVGPASKTITGTYQELNSSGPMCLDFANIRRQTYRMPATVQLIEVAYQEKAFVSNYFQLTYAIPRRSIATLDKITGFYEEVRQIGTVNQGILENYKTLKAKWDGIGAALQLIDGEIDDAYDQRRDEYRTCDDLHGRHGTDDPRQLDACYDTAYDQWRAAVDKLYLEEDTLKDEQRAMRDDYYAARGKKEAYDEELENITRDLVFYQTIYDSQMRIANSSFTIEKDVLDAEEGKVVGRAVAGYSLFGNETNVLANAIAAAGHANHEVKRLDVFNIRMNSGARLSNPTIRSGQDIIYSKNVFSFPASTLLSSNIRNDYQMPFEREDVGDTLYFEAMDESAFASGGLSFLVTKGARCGEYTGSVQEVYTSNDQGYDVSWSVESRLYDPQPNRTVFAETIGLRYNYFAFPGEIQGECSINVDRMNSYWRNSGQSKSWSWFKTKRRSWDTIKSEAFNNFGIECSLDHPPRLPDFAESKALEDQFEAEMYNDMWQMFLAVYAEEFTVEVLDSTPGEVEPSTVGKTLGTGLMKICPANVYCQFGNVVLRALDQIGGSKSTGTVSSQAREYGTIYKRYNKKTFALKEGNAVINLKVCVDSAQCN